MVNLRVSAVAPVFIIWQNQWLPIISLTSFSILKEQLTKKKKKKRILCHYLLTFMSLQTHMLILFLSNFYTAVFQTVHNSKKDKKKKHLNTFKSPWKSCSKTISLFFKRLCIWTGPVVEMPANMTLIINLLRGKVHPKKNDLWFTHHHVIPNLPKPSPKKILNLNFNILNQIKHNYHKLHMYETMYLFDNQCQMETVGLIH